VSSNSFPVIETERLVLRELALADQHAILSNFLDEAVTRWFFEHPYTELSQAKEIIREFDEKYRTGKGYHLGDYAQGP
jgi:[ribosomal protein S5]-alanine N-acetyltransferase